MVSAAKASPKEPKYAVVRERIRSMIEGGEYPPGSRLPSDHHLYKFFSVSRLTAIRALEELAEEGLVIRVNGSGTYVADTRPLIPGRVLHLGLLSRTSIRPERMGVSLEARIIGAILEACQLKGYDPSYTAKDEADVTGAVWRHPTGHLTLTAIGEPWIAQLGHPPLETVQEKRFDGLITVGINDDEWLESLVDLGIPTVLVDYPGDRFRYRADQIFLESRGGYRDAALQFLSMELKRIHFVGALIRRERLEPKRTAGDRRPYRPGLEQIEPESRARLAVCRRAMEEEELELPEGRVHFVVCGEPYLADLANKLLALPESERPQALLCDHIDRADYFAAAFAEKGLNLYTAGTTYTRCEGLGMGIRIDPEEIGTVAADLLVNRLVKPERPYLNVGARMTFEPRKI